MLCSIPGSRGGGSGLPSHRQINKVIITQCPPNRSGCMLMEKTNNIVHLGCASYLRGTETTEVEGLWLSRDPNSHGTVMAAAKDPRHGYALLLYFPPSIT